MSFVALIRHGRTAGNMRGAYIGRSDEPLCGEGKEEILRRCEAGIYPAVERVYCTPLRRTAETARLIYPSLSPIPLDGLQECDFGEYEGRSYDELKDLPGYRRWLHSGGEAPFPGGEGRRELCARCSRALTRLLDICPPREGVALVVHGGTIMALMEGLVLPEREFYSWQPKNGEGYLLDFEPGLWQKERKLTLLRSLEGRESL